MISDKTLCIMGLFDQAAEEAFGALSVALSKRGFPAEEQTPHVTFGIYEGVDQEDFLDWVSHIASNQRQLDLNFSHIGIFTPGICVAEPCANLGLLQLHRNLHAKYDQDCSEKNCLFSLKAKSWVPHTTLAVSEPEQLAAILPVLMEIFKPIDATITKLMVTEYPPMKRVREFPLK